MAFLALTTTSRAQEKQYDDLLVKYVDEKYEDCLAKAERYTQNLSLIHISEPTRPY